MRKIQAKRARSVVVALALCAVILVPAAIPAYADPVSGPWTYTISPASGAAIIMGYDGPGGHVVVPDQLAGVPVDFSPAYPVFRGREDITRVTLPAGASRVPPYAFAGTRNLERVDLPEGLTEIGDSAFLASGVTTVNLPLSVNSIGVRAFAYTPRLTQEMIIPEGVTEIPSDAFMESGISAVSLPSTLTDLSDGAFSFTANLRDDIVIPEGVTRIGSGAFVQSAITSVVLPQTLTTIGVRAFAATKRLDSDVVLPEGFTTISAGAFNGSALTGINIPSTVTSIGEGAFMATPELTSSISLPAGVTTVTDSLFAASGITAITLPSTLTSIGEMAFRQTPNLAASVAIPDTVTHIGDYAFWDSAITSVNLPASLNSLGKYAFLDTAALVTDITIPSGVIDIPQGLFFNSGVTSVTLHDGVQTIGNDAFYSNRLTQVTIPASVANAGRTIGWGLQKSAGQIFEGWHTAPQPLGVLGDYDGSPVNFSALGGVDTTIYAHWSPLEITLHANAPDADMSGLPTSADYGQSIAFGTPTRPHHVFLGWSEVANPGPGATLIGGSAEHLVRGSVELFAQWLLADYEILLHPNGSGVEGVTPVIGADHGETISLGIPRREHFTFAGWAEVPNPEAAAVLVGGDDEYVVTADAQFYAQWVPVLYDVTFRDGLGGVTTETHQSGQTVAYRHVTRPLHRLEGWRTQDGRNWDFERDTITSDTTLEAVWVERSVTHPPVIAAGGVLEVEGSGFESDDTVTISLHSGNVLGVVEASEEGTFSFAARLPQQIAPGDYLLTFSASVSGSSTSALTVALSASADESTTPAAAGTLPGADSDGAVLSGTGPEDMARLLVTASASLLVGCAVVVLARVRRQIV